MDLYVPERTCREYMLIWIWPDLKWLDLRYPFATAIIMVLEVRLLVHLGYLSSNCIRGLHWTFISNEDYIVYLTNVL